MRLTRAAINARCGPSVHTVCSGSKLWQRLGAPGRTCTLQSKTSPTGRKMSLYVFPQSEVKEDLCTRLLQHYLIYFSIGLRLAKSKVGCPPAQRLSEDTGERKAKLRSGAASIPARH